MDAAESTAPLQPQDRQLLLVFLILASLPHAFWLPAWISLTCLLLWMILLLVQTAKVPKPGRLLRVCLAAACVAAVGIGFGTISGRQAGAALLAMLVPIKILEAESRRDTVVTLFLELFLLFTAVLFSQTLLVGLYLFAVVWLAAAGMMVITRHCSNPGACLLTAGKLFLQAAPLAVLIFLLFPRLHSGLLGLSPESNQAVSGLSRSMAPGSIASLARSEKVAFRAEFHDSTPEHERLYWRAVVLRRFDGFRWTEGRPCTRLEQSLPAWSGSTEYTITLEPTGTRLMVALDLPLGWSLRSGSLEPGFLLRAEEKVESTRRYRLRSAVDYRTPRLEREQFSTCLALQPKTNPRTRQLVARLTQDNQNPERTIERVLAALSSQGLAYTLAPPQLSRTNPIDDFLFRTKQGYCEHFAQALAWMLRAAGIPSRIVAGYQGGELNPLGDYFIVRQSRAHAWVETYLPDRGWIRIDPTRELDPDNLAPGISGPAAASSGRSGAGKDGLGLLAEAWHRTILVWDGFNHAWNSWLLGYSPDRQQALLERLGLESEAGQSIGRLMLITMLAGLALLTGLCLLLLRPRHRSMDPSLKAYRTFLTKLAKAGIDRQPQEGPHDLADRVESLNPELADQAKSIISLYVRLRYREEIDARLLPQLTTQVRRFKPRPQGNALAWLRAVGTRFRRSGSRP
jgi:transglutaminase-like putative cysteine protease